MGRLRPHTPGTAADHVRSAFPLSPAVFMAGLLPCYGPGRVDVDEDGVVVHLDGNEWHCSRSVFAPIAGKFGHLDKEPLRPEDRIAALAAPGQDDDHEPSAG